MKHYTPIEKLDYILNYLSKEEKSVTINEFHIKVSLSYQETNEIFHKLKLDGNARESKEGISPHFFSVFYITFDGRYFLQKGGYKQKEKIDKLNFNASQSNVFQAKKYADRLLFATWCAAIAGMLVFAWYIFSWFCPHPSDCFCGLKP